MDVCGMFIVIGYDLGKLSSNPKWICLYFSLYEYFWERHESIFFFFSFSYK